MTNVEHEEPVCRDPGGHKWQTPGDLGLRDTRTLVRVDRDRVMTIWVCRYCGLEMNVVMPRESDDMSQRVVRYAGYRDI